MKKQSNKLYKITHGRFLKVDLQNLIVYEGLIINFDDSGCIMIM